MLVDNSFWEENRVTGLSYQGRRETSVPCSYFNSILQRHSIAPFSDDKIVSNDMWSTNFWMDVTFANYFYFIL